MKEMTIPINEKTNIYLSLNKFRTNHIRNYLFEYKIFDKKESISGSIGSFSINEFSFENINLHGHFLESIYMKSPKTEKIYDTIISEKHNIYRAMLLYRRFIIKMNIGL